MKSTFAEIASSYYNYSLRKCCGHYDVAERYKRYHRLFGIVVVITTTAVGTSVFAALSGSTHPAIQICTGLLSVVAVVLAALQTFLGFGDLQAQHKTAAAGYGMIRRDVELLVMKFPNATGVANQPETTELEALKSHLDELDRASPAIPDKIWDATAKTASKDRASWSV